MKHPRVTVVLHHSIYPSNVGAAVRAMGNMGADRLVLVDPQCEINSQAKRAAVGCQELLNNRKVYANWDEFYKSEGQGIRIGFTARAGKLRPAQEAEALFQELSEDSDGAASEAEDIYLVFGREDHGLSADDVEYLHHTCTIQTSTSYTSLNLAQAVLVGLYIMRRYFPARTSNIPEEEAETEASYYPEESIREWLETLGFDLSAQRINALRVMNQLILRNRPSTKELKILQAVLNQTVRKLKELKEHAQK